jgi:hypothetical protein
MTFPPGKFFSSAKVVMNGDFWLYLTRLADCYDNSALTPQERAARALQQFHQMPKLAQREVLLALRSMAYQLPDLYTITASTALKERMEEAQDNQRSDAG